MSRKNLVVSEDAVIVVAAPVVELNLNTLVTEEVQQLTIEIDNMKAVIKEKQKRIKKLTKKTTSSGPSKKEQATEWLTFNPEATMLEFVNWSCTTLEISPVYCTTIWKAFKKG